MKARLLPPRDNYTGNLIWCREDLIGKSNEISISLKEIRTMGYWASAYPEGDGITFTYNNEVSKKNSLDMLNDFRKCFAWMNIELASSGDINSELAEIENKDKKLDCIVIVPLDKIFIQETLTIGLYTFFCQQEFDRNPHERLSEHKGAYIQFNCQLSYVDLLKLNKTLEHNSFMINKCLSIAEYGLDLIRYSHSSFTAKEFTPNPAGQHQSGFYDVEIIPLGKTHIKPLILSGISKPLSVSNNWLGPQVDDFCYPGVQYLSAIYDKTIENEISAVVIGSLRSCRQSFYSIGEESQFLNLIFTLDGLANIDKSWTGWKHRTYIAALTCNNSLSEFEKNLEEFDMLYVDIRNKLVHQGKDFYQLPVKSDDASEKIFSYIKKIIILIEKNNFSSLSELRDYATNLLSHAQYKTSFKNVIDRVSLSRGKNPTYPSW
ncbi:hypothetical protein NKL93_000901 [Salmonella enterica]|nr:hypothetical protein [Salmonella enterica]EJO1930264.1 hypothetical protein [Salmonella enterica]